MNILQAVDHVGNPFFPELCRALRKEPEVENVTSSLEAFWSPSSGIDVVHIHWPEALFRWQVPGEEAETTLAAVLDHWRRSATLVATVHNELPHTWPADVGQRFFSLVYGRTDGLIHFGRTSKLAVQDRYPLRSTVRHAIIPHGNYEAVPNSMSRAQARQHLKLPDHAQVTLCLGELRHREELQLLVQGWRYIAGAESRLVVAGRLPGPSSHLSPMRYRIRLPLWIDGRIRLHEGWIPEHDLQLYLNACDVVVIARRQALNSGNVALGMTFGRVVVGPDIGVIGEVLRETHNPVYNPLDPADLGHAIGRGLELSRGDLGESNRELALSEWSWSRVAKEHVALYQTLGEPRSGITDAEVR